MLVPSRLSAATIGLFTFLFVGEALSQYSAPPPPPPGTPEYEAWLESLPKVPPRPAATPTPQPAPTPTPAAVVTIDLAKPAGVPQRFEVPSGLIEVRVQNAAPGARYEVRLTQPGGTGRSITLQGPYPHELTAKAAQPECEDWMRAKQAFLSVTREGEATVARDAMLRAAGESTCRLAKLESASLLSRLSPRDLKFGVAPGAPSQVAVERLDEAQKPVARWEGLLQGPDRPSGWRHRNEGEWLVASTATDIARLVRYARTRSLPDLTVEVERLPQAGKLPAYRLRFGGDAGWKVPGVDVQIQEHVWAPATYQPLAARLLALEGLKGKPSAGSDPLLVSLADLRTKVLLAENDRLSRELAESALDPRVHERAALLLGAFGLREGSGEFADLRPTLCAMAAHLALAAVLRGNAPISPEGAVASVLIDVLSDRFVPAAGGVARLETTVREPAAGPWLRALDLRASGAWKRLENPTRATLLERICYVRALEGAVGESPALDFLEQGGREPLVDWVRIFFSSGSASVEVANLLGSTAVAAELQDAAGLAEAASTASPETIVGALARLERQAEPRLGPGPRPVVASRTFLAAAAARQVLDAARAEVNGLRNMLGLEEEAQERSDELSKLLEPLPLANLLRIPWNSQRGQSGARVQGEACAKVTELLGRRPEVFTEDAWLQTERCGRERDAGILPRGEQWLEPGIPVGTAYAAPLRLRFGREKVRAEDVADLYALWPRNSTILATYAVRNLGRRQTADDIKAAWGAAWDKERLPLLMLVDLAKGSPNSANLLDLRGRQCDLDASYCMDYGAELAAADQTQKAVSAYEKAFAGARDRVAVSIDADWLADYYLDDGRPQDALRLAREVGEVHSRAGLFTHARVLERLGRLDEAEAVYRAESQRYKTGSLGAFYIRRFRRGDAAYAERASAAQKVLFESGLVPADITKMEPLPPVRTPGSGLSLDQQWRMTPRYVKAGLKAGDTILAVDGIRIGNAEQWYCVRSFTDAQTIGMIVQRAGKLIEIKGPFQREKFGPPVKAAAASR